MSKLVLLLVALCIPVCGQPPTAKVTVAPITKKEEQKPDFSKEGVVIEQSLTRVDFNTDGTSKRQQKTRVRVQSEAGIQQYGVLSFPYQGLVEHLDIEYVRVLKPDGTVVITPPDFVQDMPTEVSRTAPFYSDLREKQVAVKRLSAGDILEYAATWQQDKPLAPGNFWLSWQFTKSSVVLDEELEISIPAGREIKTKSRDVQPSERSEGDRRILTWKTAHLESQSKTSAKQDESYETARGLLPPPDVLISSFRSWEEVGRWYGGLQRDRVLPSAEVKAKTAELTKDATDSDLKLKALYNYVSLRYRYIGISFGIGRYQPHSAADILDNQYGDCKDKHTLLAALLSAAGIQAYPALINSSRAVDEDVPSPAQFDHVITVVPRGSQLLWMDSTSEVAPLGLLLPQLRDKPALVVMPEKSEFQRTPSVSPYASVEKFRTSGKLSAEGVLDSDSQYDVQGDGAVMLRLAFRRVSQAQWKDLVQAISYRGGFAGIVSDIDASSPDNTETPFKLTYHYNRKDYADWDNHRILACLPTFGLAAVSEEDLERQKPLWISYPGEWRYESRIDLPKGFTADLPKAVKLKEDFAEYEASSEMEGSALVTKRHLVIKNGEVTPLHLKSYKAFQKAISDDQYNYIQLNGGGVLAFGGPVVPGMHVSTEFQKGFNDLASSASSEAMEAESKAREAGRSGAFGSAIAGMKRAVELDPKFARAWVELGSFYVLERQERAAIESFQKAIEAEPKQAFTYKILAHAYREPEDRDQAIHTWQQLQVISPDDHDIAPNLGALYMEGKQYKEAGVIYQTWVKNDPNNGYAFLNLGMAQLRLDEKEQALAALQKALDLQPGAEMLNLVAWTMVEADSNLTQALEYSKRSIEQIEEASRAIDLKNLRPDDLRVATKITAYWDTLGWIYYKIGDLAKAENYLVAAWQLGQDGVVGDHLGQVYEKEHKLLEAAHMYALALGAAPKMEETAARLRKLSNIHVPANRMGTGEELSRMRTTSLPRVTKETASADFYVLIAPGGKLKDSSFHRGSELLRFADGDLAKISFKVPFPADSSAYLLRKAILSCHPYSGCSFVFYPITDVANSN
jgi:tetratricopeptide (TPR) repeat protein